MENKNRSHNCWPAIRNMKFIQLTMAIAFATQLTGCVTIPQARVVRLNLEPHSSRWDYSVNGGTKVWVSSESLTNMLIHLHLHQGDLVLFGMVPIRSIGPTNTWNWLASSCISNHVAVYHYIDSGEADIFSIPVYHWSAPFDNPRTLADASFFKEGEFLGRRKAGFENMMNLINLTSPPQIFILGSAYDLNTSYGPGEAPYEDDELLLESVAKTNHIEILFPQPLLGF